MEVANLLGQKSTWTLKQGAHAYKGKHSFSLCLINPLNAELNPICHLLALLGAQLIFHFSRIRVKHLTMKACGEVEVKPCTF